MNKRVSVGAGETAVIASEPTTTDTITQILRVLFVWLSNGRIFRKLGAPIRLRERRGKKSNFLICMCDCKYTFFIRCYFARSGAFGSIFTLIKR